MGTLKNEEDGVQPYPELAENGAISEKDIESSPEQILRPQNTIFRLGTVRDKPSVMTPREDSLLIDMNAAGAMMRVRNMSVVNRNDLNSNQLLSDRIEEEGNRDIDNLLT